MSRRFEHLGQQWEATGTGTGHSVGLGPDRWGVILKSRTKPDRGDLRGAISRVEPSMVDESELKATLEEQLVLAAINRSKYVWRPAEAISQETGISVARVKGILERTVAGVIAGDTNGLGQQLYTTREHLSKTSADFTRQFFLVQESS